MRKNCAEQIMVPNRDRYRKSAREIPTSIANPDCDPDSDSDDSGVLSFCHFHIHHSRLLGVISGRMCGAASETLDKTKE
jgi:hypothetical protein